MVILQYIFRYEKGHDLDIHVPRPLALLHTGWKQKAFIASSSVMTDLNPTHFLTLSPICKWGSHAGILVLVLLEITRLSLPACLYTLHQRSHLSLPTKQHLCYLNLPQMYWCILSGASNMQETLSQWIHMGRVEENYVQSLLQKHPSEPFLQQSYTCS